MKNKIKKILAMVCCLAVGISLVAVMGAPASAAGEYFTITENNRNLFINVDQEIALADISVVINGVALSGEDVAWSCTDAAVSFGGGLMIVSKKGVFTVDVEDADGNPGTVTVITKNADETEYVLYEEDFDEVANGTLPEGWTEFKNADVVADATAQAAFPNYIATSQVKDGVLYIGNGYNTAYNYVWLPAFLDSFGDYKVSVNMAQSWVYSNVRAGGIVTRGDRTETTGAHPLHGYRIFIRRATTGADGMRLTSLARIDNVANKTDAALPFPIGSTRTWSRPDWTGAGAPAGTEPSPWFTPAESVDPDWKGEGYMMTWEVTNSGYNYTLDAYKSYEQGQFGGDMGPGNGGAWWETYHLKDDPSLAGYEMSVNTENWDAVDLCETGAIGLFTSGVQLAVDSVKVTVPASILAANPDMYEIADLDPALAVYQSQKIAVMSDVHLQVGSTAADYALKAALTKFKADGVSAVLFTGDLVNTGVDAEYEKFISIWDSVFPDAATAPKRLTITGNHEHEGVYFRGETLDETYERYLEAFGYDEANFHEVVNGIHIIGINTESHLVDGQYTLETTMWLEEQLADAKAADPYAPIIVMCHQPLPNTTYGSSWGATSTTSLYETLRYYPQVVYLAGHTHFDSTNEKSIMQKDFTCVDVPSMQYTTVENGNGGTSAATYDYQNYLVLDIDGQSKTMDIHRYKSYEKNASTHEYETVEIKDAWTLNLPLSKKNFTYTAARAETRQAPTFAAGAVVEVVEPTSDSVSIKFPAATHDDYVHAYNITVTDTAGEVMLSKYFVSDFYAIDGKATEYAVDLEGLPSNTKLIINVTAMESYGKTSAPITAETATEPINTPSAGFNVADFFDVNTAVGFEDNSPYRRQYSLYVKSHPIKLVQDEELGRQVAYMGGWVNYPTSQGALKEITESFTIELAFKTPAEAITAGQCLFGNPESGGVTVEYTGAGVFQVGAHIGGGYKYIQAPALELDTWYHLAYTFDGEKSVLYLNGVKVGEVESVGTVKYNSAVNFLTIGANVNAAGNAASVFYGHIALARVYTQPMAAADVIAAYKLYQNDNAYNAVYQKALALYNLDAAKMTDAEIAKIEALIEEAGELLDNAALTEKAAEDYVAEVEALLTELAAAYDISIPWTLFSDKFDDFTKVTEKIAAGIQWENNAEIKKTLFSKNQNVDVYVMYELPGYVRNIELDALSVATEYDFGADFKFFVSKDGEKWDELEYDFTEPAANAINAYWMESTVSPKAYIKGDYKYVKIQLNEFGMAFNAETGTDVQRVNWSTVMDGVRIWYTNDAHDLDNYDPNAPADPEDPEKPGDDSQKPGDPEKPNDGAGKPGDGEQKPGDTSPETGDNVLGTVLALIALIGCAAVAIVSSKKRVNN